MVSGRTRRRHIRLINTGRAMRARQAFQDIVNNSMKEKAADINKSEGGKTRSLFCYPYVNTVILPQR